VLRSEIGFSIVQMAALNMCSSAMLESLGIVTYNLHGINSGRSLLVKLCDDPSVSIIAIQEHWLTANNLHLSNSIHPDFIGFGISAMSKRLEK
jgi:hypothetical protein